MSQSVLKNRKRDARAMRRRSETSKKQIAVKRFAEVTIRAIRANYFRSAFTRDDILSLISKMRLDSTDAWAADSYGINDLSTSTRVRKVGEAVQYLLSQRALVSLDWLRLCLPEVHGKLSQETPPQIMYVQTIRNIIKQNCQPEMVLDAMSVVRLWHSDQHVPESVKRMAVRGVFPRLLRERLLRRGEDDRFIVRTI